MEISIDADFDFELTCDGCGNALDISTERVGGTTIYLKIYPCQRCLDKEHEKGYKAGYEDNE